MGHGDPFEGMIIRLQKVKTDPNFEPVRALPEGASFDGFLNAMQLWDLDERDKYSKCSASGSVRPMLLRLAHTENSVRYENAEFMIIGSFVQIILVSSMNGLATERSCSCLASHPPKLNTTSIVVSTSTGSPFSMVGRYRHSRTASIAALISNGGPEM
jgi:hypothetical protein